MGAALLASRESVATGDMGRFYFIPIYSKTFNPIRLKFHVFNDRLFVGHALQKYKMPF